VTVLGGVGFDRDALLRDLDSLLPQVGLVGLLDGLQLGAVLLDHPLVVVGGHRGQPLRDQIVEGVAGANLDDVALVAEILDVVDQQQLDAAAGTDREAIGDRGVLGLLGLNHRQPAYLKLAAAIVGDRVNCRRLNS
jgi:hypothetical protein